MSRRRSRGGTSWRRLDDAEDDAGADVAGAPFCAYCARPLARHLAHIRCAAPACAETDLRLCADCFSVGAANLPHKSDHPYRVQERLNTPLFAPGWPAHSELALLNALADHGPHNWHAVGRAVGVGPRKCEAHYHSVYLDHSSAPLPTDAALRASAPTSTPRRRPRSVAQLATPPHSPQGVNEDSAAGSARELRARARARAAGDELLGYAPKRGDFDVEYDDDAEDTIAELEIGEDDNEEAIDLKVRLLEIYNERLEQREAIKKLVVENKLQVSSLSAKKMRKAAAAAAARRKTEAKKRTKRGRSRVTEATDSEQSDAKRTKIIRADDMQIRLSRS